MLLLSAKSPFKSLQDMLSASRPVKFAASGRSDGMGDVAATTCEALAMNCKIITGYKGSKASALAAIQGEADAITISESSSKKMTKGGKMIPIITLASKHASLFPDIPTIFEQVKLSPKKAWWINFRSGLAKIGRTLVTTPGVPADRVAFLRQSIKQVLTNKKVIAQSKKIKREIRYDSPESVEKLVKGVLVSLNQQQLKEVKIVLLEKF